MPPTPTPLPPVEASFSLPESYTLWGATDTAITYWQLTGDAGTVSQVIILAVLVFLGIKVFIGYMRQLIQRDSDE